MVIWKIYSKLNSLLLCDWWMSQTEMRSFFSIIVFLCFFRFFWNVHFIDFFFFLMKEEGLKKKFEFRYWAIHLDMQTNEFLCFQFNLFLLTKHQIFCFSSFVFSRKDLLSKKLFIFVMLKVYITSNISVLMRRS